MKCVVTGAAGFVGSTLSERLLREGHEVLGLDSFVDYYPRKIKEKNLEHAKSYSKFRFQEADLLKSNLEELLEGSELIFHQAAQAGVRASWGSTFSIYTDNNILSSQRLLEAVRSDRVKSTFKKIVYASSSSVYGSAEQLPTSELILPKPVSPYGVSKLAAEHLMLLYTSEFNVSSTSLRYFTVYGPRQRPDMAFHRIIRAGLKGEKFTLFGDGEQTRDFTFIEDIIDANISAAMTETKHQVFNIGGGNRISMNKVIMLIENTIGRKMNIERIERAKGDAAHTGADTTLAQAELRYSPKMGLEEGLSYEAQWIDEMLRSQVL